MKAGLSEEQGISILALSEDVTPVNAPVLRSGLTKLLKSGKNKIILDLTKTGKIAGSVLEEIIHIDFIAKQLNGSVILVGRGDLIQEIIKKLPGKITVKYFSTIDAAFDAFGGKHRSMVNFTNEELENHLTALKAENTALKERAAKQSADEIKRYRIENAQIGRQIKFAYAHVKDLLRHQTAAGGGEAIQARINEAEKVLFDFLGKDGLAQ